MVGGMIQARAQHVERPKPSVAAPTFSLCEDGVQGEYIGEAGKGLSRVRGDPHQLQTLGVAVPL